MSSRSRRCVRPQPYHVVGRRPRPVRSLIVAFPPPSPMGFFERLPSEILEHVFAHLSYPQIGHLSQTSSAMRSHVSFWLATKSSRARLRGMAKFELSDEVEDKENEPPVVRPYSARKEAVFDSMVKGFKPYRDYAVMIKRLTCLLSTQERLNYADKAFKIILGEAYPSNSPGSVEWRSTSYAALYSLMLQTFTSGWDDSEYPSLLNDVDRKFGLSKKLAEFLQCGRTIENACVASEMELRLTLRCLSWDFAGKDFAHRATWLLAILKRLLGENTAPSQALLFFLLFGPPCKDALSHYNHPVAVTDEQKIVLNELHNHADWDIFIDTLPDDFHEGKAMFFPLAQAVCSCMTAAEKWKNEMMSDVLECLFQFPTKWKRENVAGFLLFCSEKFILEYLQRKLDDDTELSFNAVARLLVDMIVVSYKFDNDLNAQTGIGKIFDKVCSYPSCYASRALLGQCIFQMIDTEINSTEESRLDMDDDDLLEILNSFGAHISKKACSETSRYKQMQENMEE